MSIILIYTVFRSCQYYQKYDNLIKSQFFKMNLEGDFVKISFKKTLLIALRFY